MPIRRLADGMTFSRMFENERPCFLPLQPRFLLVRPQAFRSRPVIALIGFSLRGLVLLLKAKGESRKAKGECRKSTFHP
jgi:hypothetical protein